MAGYRIYEKKSSTAGKYDIIVEEGNVVKVLTLNDDGVSLLAHVCNKIIYRTEDPEPAGMPELRGYGD